MAPRSIVFFTLSIIAGLVALPMYTNLQGHNQFASLLRRMMSDDAALQNITITSTGSLLPPPMLASDIGTEIHDSFLQATNDAGIPLANLSSVDYSGCCGLGHRLVRMANAAWIAKRLHLGLHTFWGYCGNDTEIFQHLFGVQTKEDLRHVTSTNHYAKYHNEVPGFEKLRRYGRIYNRTCPCQEEHIQANRDFYVDLRNRFRYKQQVDEFVKTTFSNFTVLGLHIRAGNGETGDFVKKNRGISEIHQWVKQASKRIIEHVHKQRQDWKDPPLLYIATDTPSLIEKFRHELQGSMPVIEFPQERQEEGQGVYFGEGGKHAKLDDYKCIRQWENAVTDMILLSHANVLIAGRISSFVQAMPMSLVFGRKNQKVKEPNCELNLDASDMICSSTYLEWCCDIRGPKINPVYRGETIKVPHNMNTNLYQTEQRPPFKETPHTNLPYYWKPQGYDDDDDKSTVDLNS